MKQFSVILTGESAIEKMSIIQGMGYKKPIIFPSDLSEILYVFCWKDGDLSYGHKNYEPSDLEKFPLMTIHELRAYAKEHPNKPDLPNIDSRRVLLTKSGIKVGCTEVPHADLKTIYKASKKNQKSL